MFGSYLSPLPMLFSLNWGDISRYHKMRKTGSLFQRYGINRFLETMRGVQRILFVGTGICIENYPVLAGEKWKCIYTTNQSDRLADTFSRAERQVRPIYTKHEYDSARTKLDQNNPLLVFINGRASKENDDEDIDQEVERRENSKLLLKSMTSLLKSDLMVELVIVGYNPQDNGELSPYDLYAELRLLSDNRVVSNH